MNRKYTLLILGALLIFYAACQKDGKASPNANQTVKPASPTDLTKKSTIHATKITDTFRQLPIIYPYTQTATGIMHNFFNSDYDGPNVYDSSYTFVFYILHVSKDSIQFTSQWGDFYDYHNINVTFGVNSANIYNANFSENSWDPKSNNFRIVNDSLYASWVYSVPEGCVDWGIGIGTFAGKIQ